MLKKYCAVSSRKFVFWRAKYAPKPRLQARDHHVSNLDAEVASEEPPKSPKSTYGHQTHLLTLWLKLLFSKMPKNGKNTRCLSDGQICLRCVPDFRRYFLDFRGVLLILLKPPRCLSDGRAPLVGDLGPILFSKKQTFWRILHIIFSASLIFLVKKALQNSPKSH